MKAPTGSVFALCGEWGLGTAIEGTHRGANKDSRIAEKSLKGKPTNCMNLKALNS